MVDHWLRDTYGGDLCAEIKSNPQTSDIPVVLISALQGLDIIATNSRADGYLRKPFDIEDLQHLVRKHLNAI